MKKILLIILLFTAVAGNAQRLEGKWKPVYFSFDTLARGDVKADTLYITPYLSQLFAEDKDPAGSEQMIRFFIGVMFKQVKNSTEEYTADGKFVITNTTTKRSRNGTYRFDPARQSLERSYGMEKTEVFTVSWKGSQLVLETEMESSTGKKGRLEVIYEKL